MQFIARYTLVLVSSRCAVRTAHQFLVGLSPLDGSTVVKIIFGGRALVSVIGLLTRATRNNGKSDRSLNFMPFYYCKIEVETDKK